MPIAIAIKPIPGRPGMDDAGPQDAPSDVGMSIVDQCKQLDPQAVQTLTRGISPEALEVMEQIPELAPFANYIEHGSTDEESPEGSADAGPLSKHQQTRSDIASVMRSKGVPGDY